MIITIVCVEIAAAAVLPAAPQNSILYSTRTNGTMPPVWLSSLRWLCMCAPRWIVCLLVRTDWFFFAAEWMNTAVAYEDDNDTHNDDKSLLNRLPCFSVAIILLLMIMMMMMLMMMMMIMVIVMLILRLILAQWTVQFLMLSFSWSQTDI